MSDDILGDAALAKLAVLAEPDEEGNEFYSSIAWAAKFVRLQQKDFVAAMTTLRRSATYVGNREELMVSSNDILAVAKLRSRSI